MLENFGPILLILVTAALISDLAGTLNIGIEGILYLGSFLISVSVFPLLGPIMGFMIVLGSGVLIGWFMGLLHTRLQANVFILGLGINLLCLALVPILNQLIFHQKGRVDIPISIPPDLVLVITWVVAIIIFVIVFLWHSWTLIGIRFRSLSNHADMLYARGVNVDLYKMHALGISGGLAALAGALTSIHFSSFTPNVTSGKGWLALILLYVGAKHPLGIVAACFAYLAVDQWSIELQGVLDHPELAVGLPYVGVLAVLVLVQVLTKRKLEL